jgi:cyclopropane fatty-acyl-phospholipid synthase-like methyltransferase
VPSRHEVVVDHLDPQPTDRVAEVGCGWGVAATHVLDRLTTGTYVGVDRSSTMVAAATERNAAAVAAGRAAFVAAPAEELAGGPFDRVFAARVRAMASAPALAAASGALVPGGLLLLAIDAPSPATASGAAVMAASAMAASAMAAAGFRQLRCVEAPFDEGVVVCVSAVRP